MVNFGNSCKDLIKGPVKDPVSKLATFLINSFSGAKVSADRNQPISIDLNRSIKLLWNCGSDIDLQLLFEKTQVLLASAFEEYNALSKVPLELVYDISNPTVFQANRPIHYSDVAKLIRSITENSSFNRDVEGKNVRKKFAIDQIKAIEL